MIVFLLSMNIGLFVVITVDGYLFQQHDHPA